MKKVLILLFLFHNFIKGDFMTTRSIHGHDLSCSPLTPFLESMSSHSNRNKRSAISLPNTSSFAISSLLRIPTPPQGFNIIWIQVNFFIKPMFRDPQGPFLLFCLFIGIYSVSGVKVPVKRLHSRQRRFAAPGTIWDIIFGLNILWPDANLIFDIIIRNELDTLFGGTDALQELITLQSGDSRSNRIRRNINNSSGLNVSFFGRKKRNTEDNFLVKSLEEDQVFILSKLEEAITKMGINGRQCVLRAVCELKETPIHEWSVLGEMLSILFRPKEGNHSMLNDYKEAEKLGSKHGNCWSHYPKCPISIFNVIPDLYTKDDEIEIDFDGGLGAEP